MTRPLHKSWLEPVATAHNAAIDRLCLNLLAGAPSLKGVSEEYRETLAVERSLSEAFTTAALGRERN